MLLGYMAMQQQELKKHISIDAPPITLHDQ